MVTLGNVDDKYIASKNLNEEATTKTVTDTNMSQQLMQSQPTDIAEEHNHVPDTKTVKLSKDTTGRHDNEYVVHPGLTHEQSTCIKTALALVIIKRRWQNKIRHQDDNVESNSGIPTDRSNPLFAILPKHYNTNNDRTMNTPRRDEKDCKVSQCGNSEGNFFDTTVEIDENRTKSVSWDPTLINKTKTTQKTIQSGQPLPSTLLKHYDCGIWPERIHHFMCLASKHHYLLVVQQSIINHDNKTNDKTYDATKLRWSGLIVHIASSIENVYENLLLHKNYIDRWQYPKNELDQTGYKSNDPVTSYAPITLVGNDNVSGSCSIPELTEWIEYHLTCQSPVSNENKDNSTNEPTDKNSNNYSYSNKPYYFPVWEGILQERPETMSILLAPVLLQLLLPHTIRYSHCGTGLHCNDKDNNVCTFYLFQLFDKAIQYIVFYDEREKQTCNDENNNRTSLSILNCQQRKSVVVQMIKMLFSSAQPSHRHSKNNLTSSDLDHQLPLSISSLLSTPLLLSPNDLAYLFHKGMKTAKSCSSNSAFIGLPRKKSTHRQHLGSRLFLEYGLSNVLQHLLLIAPSPI